MHRFYITQKVKDDTAIVSDTAQFHHLKNVLRLKGGDEVTVCDREGNEFVCAILKLEKDRAVLAVKARRTISIRKVGLTIACAIPKQAKFDEIVDSLTQLGVERIIPMETERVIVRLDDARKAARLKRWRIIAQSAAAQSQRNVVPAVEAITTFENVLLHYNNFDLKLLPTLSGDRKHISEVLGKAEAHNILVLIGPEGDFTPEEVELAQKAGFILVSLGESVLRVGTAAIAIVSHIRLASGG